MSDEVLTKAPELTEAQALEIRRLKAYFPFRICYGVIDRRTGEFHAFAKTTKHHMNREVREGNFIYTFQS